MHNCLNRYLGTILKSFDVFICHKKSSGKDFADHLKAGLEELGYHSFLDSKDIPKIVDGKEEWIAIRDQALKESNMFILIITPGFDLSQEVKNELKLARDAGNKKFIYFRHRDLGRKIIVDLDAEKVDLGRQEQVSFDTKEELLRLAHGILKNSRPKVPSGQLTPVATVAPLSPQNIDDGVKCAACSKTITGAPHVEMFDGKSYSFDSVDCAKTYRRLKSVYGEYIQ
jgi:hypothetical protein